jgi:multiple antibiotic resistance protein
MLVAFVVLCVFIFTGNAILRFVGIQPGSFFIAGGILMFIVSIDLLLGKPGRTKTSADAEEEDREDVSIFPLAIPMLAGPGTITTILLYVSEVQMPGYILPVLVGSVVFALAVAGLTMLLSSFFLRILGRTGVSVIERIMGIVLTGLSVQFVYDGLVRLGVLGGH